jgi:hypothetical protein
VPEAYRRGWIDRVAGMPVIKFRIYHGTPGESVDVDLFVVQTEFQQQIIQRRIQTDVENLGPTWIVSPEDLVLLKLIASRPRDLGDIDDVRFMHGELDATYMRRWAERLGIVDELEAQLSKPPT